jgi:hypothetical protein
MQVHPETAMMARQQQAMHFNFGFTGKGENE